MTQFISLESHADKYKLKDESMQQVTSWPSHKEMHYNTISAGSG